MTEDRFRSQVVRYARQCGWKTMFIGRAKGGKAWLTPMGGDGKGWPDLTLVRERVIVAELKTNTNYHISDEERDWLAALGLAGIETYVWRPRQWNEICDTLNRRDPDRWARLLGASDGDTTQATVVQRMLEGRHVS